MPLSCATVTPLQSPRDGMKTSSGLEASSQVPSCGAAPSVLRRHAAVQGPPPGWPPQAGRRGCGRAWAGLALFGVLPVRSASCAAPGTPADVLCGPQVSQMGLKLEEVKTKKPLGCVVFGGAACAAPAGRRRQPLPSADMLRLRHPPAALSARGELGRRAQCGPGFKHCGAP